MNFNPDKTFTDLDFKRPLLDPSEERLARDLNRDSALHVDGLRYSLIGRFLSLFGGKR